jgi:2-oxoisovalerate dehydrogenase E1 component alpha subunit
MCYRFLSHTTDDDERTYRTREEVAEQRVNDPLPRFEKRLANDRVITAEEIERLKKEIAARVNATTDAVEQEPSPEPATLYTQVYEGSCDAWV